jgi:hypothetical protein
MVLTVGLPLPIAMQIRVICVPPPGIGRLTTGARENPQDQD